MIKRWFKNTRYQTIKRYGDETYGETDRKFDCLDNGNSENVKEVIDMQYKELQVAIAKDLEKIKNFKLGIDNPIATLNKRIETSLNQAETKDQTNTDDILSRI